MPTPTSGWRQIASVAALLLTLAWCFVPAHAEEASDDRLALVIANRGYNASVGALANTRRSAGLVAEALRNSQFHHDGVAEDLDQERLTAAVEAFATKVRAAATSARASGRRVTTFLYYAGHGVADAQGRNHFVAIDAVALDDSALGGKQLALNAVVAALHTAAPDGNHFVVFDACRTPGPAVRQSRQGFRRVDPEHVPEGVYLTLSAEIGRSAPDAPLFADRLARAIVRANMPAEEAFARLRESVLKDSGQRQVPVTIGRLNSRVLLGHATGEAADQAVYEAVAARTLVFTQDRVPAYRAADVASGLVEIVGQGAVHTIAGAGELFRVIGANGRRWITYQTPWGRAYVGDADVRLE